MIEKYLENPEKEYRGTPFWSWNEKLTPDELTEQIREMKKVGLGGAFMHARAGLTTEYMSKEWFDCIRACVDEGEKQDMAMWSYDENGWPSGFAGGEITQMGDEYRLKHIEISDNPQGGTVIACYAVNGSSYRFLGTSVTDTANVADENEKIYYIKCFINEYYVDILDPKVVRAFIDSTYERYKRELGEKFGGKMPGFFTDEPQYARAGVPYSFVFCDCFKKKYGYDMLPGLICVFLKLDGFEEFRYDFWKMVNELYTESYAKQIYEWCEKNGCKFTGHAMAEQSLMSQMMFNAGVMPMYEYMHIPGMDWLRREISSPVIPKQVSSVACQLGKKQVLSETYAMCGWDVSFEELKWIGEWQYVNGVNFMCQHLQSYTIKGCRKRDYPPSMFIQSPWWEDYKPFNDYFARLGKISACGEQCVKTLVIHPMHSGWLGYSSREGDNSVIAKSDRDFVDCLKVLTSNHVEYHLGDESIISRHGSVCKDKLQIGKCVYSLVVIPACITLDEDVFKLLCEFENGGGTVLIYGDAPTKINGRGDERIKALTEKTVRLPKEGKASHDVLLRCGVKEIEVLDKNGECGDIHVTKRIFEGEAVYLLANQSKEKSYCTRVSFPDSERAMMYDAVENRTLPVYRNGKYITLTFDPMQSYILTVDNGEKAAESCIPFNKTYLSLGNGWKYTPQAPNAVTLDYARYRVGGGEMSESLPVLEVQRQLIAGRTTGEVEVEYTFTVSPDVVVKSLGKIMAAHEYSGFDVLCNGKTVNNSPDGYYIDRRIKTVDITDYVKNGINTLSFKGEFYQNETVYKVLFGENVHETMLNKLTYDTEIESVYVIGDFSVDSLPFTYGERRAMYTDGGFVINTLTDGEKDGNIVENGYPFYSGKITLSQNIVCDGSNTRKFIKLPDMACSLCKLYVNGQKVKTIMWSEREAEVTDFVKEGENLVAIELTVSNRNLLGPHHHPDGEIYYVAPSSFAPHGNFAPESWRSSYCFVSEGLI